MAIKYPKIKDVPNIQDMAYCLGQEGCLYTVLCILAEQIGNVDVDILKSAQVFIQQGVVDYAYDNPRNHLKEAFFVKNRDYVLSFLSGKKCTTKKVKTLPKNYNGVYYIQYGNGNYTHFILPDYNPMYHSNTVAKGTIDYYVLVTVEG